MCGKDCDFDEISQFVLFRQSGVQVACGLITTHRYEKKEDLSSNRSNNCVIIIFSFCDSVY